MGSRTGGWTQPELDALVAFSESALLSEHASQWWESAAEVMLGPLLHADVVAVASIDHRGAANGTFGLIRPAWAEVAVPSGSAMHTDLIADHPLTLHLEGPRALSTVRVSDLAPALQWSHMAHRPRYLGHQPQSHHNPRLATPQSRPAMSRWRSS